MSILAIPCWSASLGIRARLYLDLWIEDGDHRHAIELKYKTRSLAVTIAREEFDLLDQAAQDIGRYDFIKDVQRLEQVAATDPSVIGHAVLLTNDRSYWSTSRDHRTVDAAYRLHEGRHIEGELAWGAGASPGTMRSREKAIKLESAYSLAWDEYSEPATGVRGTFRYLYCCVNS